MKCKDNLVSSKVTYEELEARIRELERENQDLKSAVRLLSKKEQAIQALVNAPTESALLIEPEQGVVLACNEVAARSLNRTVEGLVGLSIYDALSADLAESRRRQAEQVVRSGKPVHFQDRQGGRTYDINVYPVLSPQRRVTQVAVFAQEVTERVKNEEALKENQRRYRLLVENQNDLIVKADKEYRFLYVSPSYCETFGKTEEELLGRQCMPLIHEDDRAMVANSLKGLFQEPYTCYHEERALTKSGWRWLAWSGRAELNEKGQVEAILAIGRDITERKQAEEALKRSEELYRMLADRMRDGLGVQDERGIAVYANNSLCDMLGYRRDEIIGRKVIDFVGEASRVRYRERISKEREGEIESFEQVLVRKDGKKIDAIISPNVITGEGGDYEGAFAVITDISERKQMEEALRLSEARLRTVIDCLPFDLFVIGKDGRYEMVNAVSRRRWGNVVGKRPEDLEVDDNTLALWKENNRRAFFGETVKGEVEFSNKGAKGYYYNIISPVSSKEEILGILGVNIDISRIKETEEALKESERKYRILIELSPDAIVILQDQHYQFVNPAFSRIFGYTKEDVDRGLSFFELVREGDKEAVRQQYERRLRGEDLPKNYDIELVAKDGRTIPSETSATLIDYMGRPADLVIIRDITERKRVETALHESDKRYRELVETMNEGLASIDKNMRFTYVNDKFCQMLGYARDDLIGSRGTDFYDEINQKIYLEQIARRRRGEHDPYEIAFTHKTGQQIFAIVSPRPIFDAQGHYAGSFAVITDITGRKQAERALQESEEKYRILVEQSQEGIVIFQGSPPRIIFANSAMGEIYGYGTREIMAMSGEQIGELIYSDDREMIMTRLTERLQGKEVPPRYEVRGIRKDGRMLWLDVSATRITYRGAYAAQATFMDITDRKLAEQELQRAHDELEIRVKERTTELRDAFKELEVKSKSLEETNTALKVLLEKRDGDKIELEGRLIANVNQLVEPYLEKLKNTDLDERQKAFLKIVKSNLKDITSPFLKSLDRQHLKLTPTEIQVAELVKQGKSAKEIADLMNLSWKTIKTHRRNIRSKLNLKNKKTNLRSYLMSYQQ